MKEVKVKETKTPHERRAHTRTIRNRHYEIYINTFANAIPPGKIQKALAHFNLSEEDLKPDNGTITLRVTTYGAFNDLKIALSEAFVSFNSNLD